MAGLFILYTNIDMSGIKENGGNKNVKMALAMKEF